MHIRTAFFALLLGSGTALAGDLPSNAELREIKNEDQAARSGNSIDWKVVSLQDAERRKHVAILLRDGKVRTSEDYFNAALVYQHGQTADDIRLAYSMASIAVALDSENKAARWLTAAAWDRIMMQVGQPQWYGTQYSKSTESGDWQLYRIDESIISDEERKRLGVPSLEEAKSRVPKGR